MDIVSKKNILSKDMIFDEAYMLRNSEDKVSTVSLKGKQAMKVERDDKHSLAEEYDDKESSRNSRHW